MLSKGIFFIRTIVLCLAMIIVSMAINFTNLMSMQPALREGLCLTGLMLLMTSFKPVRVFISTLPKPHFIIFIVFFVLTVSGQLIDRSRATFPFVKWSMFGKEIPSNTVLFFEYWGIHTDGHRVNINPAGLFPSLLHGTLVERLDVMVRHVLREDTKIPGYPRRIRPYIVSWTKNLPFGLDVYIEKATHGFQWAFADSPIPTQSESKLRLNKTLTAIGQAYNRHRAEKPIQSIEVFKCLLDLSQKPPSIKRMRVWTVTLETEDA